MPLCGAACIILYELYKAVAFGYSTKLLHTTLELLSLKVVPVSLKQVTFLSTSLTRWVYSSLSQNYRIKQYINAQKIKYEHVKLNKWLLQKIIVSEKTVAVI